MGLKTVKDLISKDIDIDSAAYLFQNKDKTMYVISDRYSPNFPDEYPNAHFSLIIEGDRDHQLRIAISGKYHLEHPSYFSLDPKKWKTWNWICIHKKEINKLISFLESCKRYLNIEESEDEDVLRFMKKIHERKER